MKKILVIEDDTCMRWLLEKMLNNELEKILPEAYEVTGMPDGMAAWSLLSEGTMPALIIKDFNIHFSNNSSDHYPHLNNSITLSNEIDFRYTTVNEVLDKISKNQITTDAVVVSPRHNFSEIVALREVTAQRDLPLILHSSNFDQEVK